MSLKERVPVLDLMALAGSEELYPLLAEMRRESPIVKGSIPLTWAVTRHADVAALLRDDRLGHQFPRQYTEFMFGDGPATDFQQNILLNRDPRTTPAFAT